MTAKCDSLKTSSHAASIISGVFLVAGTCIGAGMLALPVVTGVAGFYPAMVINVLCWLFMLATGLLFLEATLWMKEGANIISMSGRFLGPVGKIIGGLSFIFLYYCLMVSYLAGGTPLFVSVLEHFTGITLDTTLAYILFTLLFGSAVLIGARVVDRVNWVLMIGLVTSYFLLVGVGSTEVQWQYLQRHGWGLSLLAAPTLFSAYGYHNVIPSLATYLKKNPWKLRLAIIFGTTIPFVVYSIWQWMIIGSLTYEELAAASARGESISQTLHTITGHPWVSQLGMYFGFFALVTSLLGVSLSMVDFLADGLSVSSKGFNRLLLCALVFAPPALFAAHYPGIFIMAMGIAGGFGETILNGILPVLMVWVGRYRMGLTSEYRLPGGRTLLVILLTISVFIMALEFHLLLG